MGNREVSGSQFISEPLPEVTATRFERSNVIAAIAAEISRNPN